jgi:hypothetical protein
MNVAEFLRRHPPLPVGLLLGATVLVAWSYLPLSTSLRALFVVVSFAVSAVVFYATTDPDESAGRDSTAGVGHSAGRRGSDWTYAKVVTVAAALALCTTVWFDARGPSIAAFLAVGYLAVAAQLRSDPPTSAILYELVVLFAIPLLAKVLTTGLYFGSGDVLSHVLFVQQMLEAGSVDAMTPSYARYPGFHLLVGSVRELLGLATYDAIVLTGLVIYSVLVPVVYLTAAALTDDEMVALGAGVAFTLFLTPKSYVLAFYPQALAVAMLFVGLYLNANLLTAANATTTRRYTAIVLFLVVAMATTHHLTFFIASIPVVILLVFLFAQWLFETGRLRHALSSASNVRYTYAFPLVFATIVLFTYWLYTPSIFLSRIVGGLVTFFVLAGGGGGGGTYEFGAVPKVDEIQLATEWLVTPDGIYAAVLGTLLLVGFYELVRNWRSYRGWFPVHATGLILGGLLLPLPFPIPWFNRIRLVLITVVVFPVGIAVARTCRTNLRYPRYAVAGIVLVAAGTSVMFTPPVARDLNNLHTDKYRVQVEYSEREYGAMQSMASFLDERETVEVWGTPMDAETLRAEGAPNASYGVWIEEDGIGAYAGLMVVREQWTEHKLVDGNSVATFSEERFDATVARHNKVYEGDGIALLWSDSPFVGVFGANETATGNVTSHPPEP